MSITIERYTPSDVEEWNAFVADSRNGTFLFNRGYMDYHADRFADSSLIIKKGGKTVALLPATIVDDMLVSHAGLTYGGLLMPRRGFDASTAIEALSEISRMGRLHGLKGLRYKSIPYIYHKVPAQDDLYALWYLGARIAETNISSTIDLTNPVGADTSTRRNARLASKAGVYVERSQDVETFWTILADNLRQRHNAIPVHTAGELRMLMERFPDNIKLYMAYSSEGEPLGGMMVFETPMCVHCQYIASTPRGREMKILPLVTEHLVETYRPTHRYLDFGTCNENHGRVLNQGLLEQKSRLGGRGTVYRIYRLDF